MKLSAVIKIVKDITLFSALGDTDINFLIKKSKINTYLQGQEIDTCDKIAVILKGSVTVTGQKDEKRLLIRILGVGSISGVASLFGDEHGALTTLTAQKLTEVLVIPHEAVEQLIERNPAFAMSYIKFLTSRIRFLNGRIKAYTVDSAEEKLAFHLYISEDHHSGKFELPISLSTLADMLDMGRASLYRAFDSLISKGIISREGRTITVKDEEGLKRISHGQF